MQVQARHLQGALVNCHICHLSEVRKCRPGDVSPTQSPQVSLWQSQDQSLGSCLCPCALQPLAITCPPPWWARVGTSEPAHSHLCCCTKARRSSSEQVPQHQALPLCPASPIVGRSRGAGLRGKNNIVGAQRQGFRARLPGSTCCPDTWMCG